MVARIIERAATAMGTAAAVATGLLGVTIIADVIGRNVFNAPIIGALEVVQYWWMVAIVWLGIGYAQQLDEHLRVTLLPGGLGKRGAASLTGVANVLGIICGILLLGPSWQAAVESASIGQTVVSSVPVPIWPFAFLVPIGFIMFIVVCLSQAADCTRIAFSKVDANAE